MLEMAAMMGVQFLGNALTGLGQREQMRAQKRLTNAQNLVNKAQVAASNTIRDANNELSAVVGSLNRFKLNASNRQSLRNSGREQEAIQTNLIRVMKDLTGASLEQRLDSSFELGSLAAASAAAGVGGNSREVMNATLRMAEARKQQALSEQGEALTYDALKMLTNTQADAYAGLDSSIILDQLDLSQDQYIPQFAQSAPSMFNVLLNAGVQTVAQNPGLTQMALEGPSTNRSTAPPNNGRTFQGAWGTSLRI